MNEVDLFTRLGQFVSTVKILPLQTPPEVVGWGDRIFVRREDGKYYEGFVAVAVGRVENPKEKRPGEPQTCPRRDEGFGSGVEGEDRWELTNWKFTDPEEARKYNIAEAERQNADAKAKGHNSTSYPNERYWLWPKELGPMPRTCSYCGGIHPADAIKLVLEFNFDVEGTTKGYKLYLHGPGYTARMKRMLEQMRGGTDPVEAASASGSPEIYPPLKAYSPHFTDDQWRQLFSRRSP